MREARGPALSGRAPPLAYVKYSPLPMADRLSADSRRRMTEPPSAERMTLSSARLTLVHGGVQFRRSPRTVRGAAHVPAIGDRREASAQEARAHRQLAAILAADVVGYTRLMERDEQGTYERLTGLRRRIIEPAVDEHKGHVFKDTGDGFLAAFPTAESAMRAAMAIQHAAIAAESGVSPAERIAFRIGLNVADVIVRDGDVFGDGVNVAARLQGYAEPGGIAIPSAVAEQLGTTFGMQAVDLGRTELRNRSHPVHILSLRFSDVGPARIKSREPRPSIAVLPFRKLSLPQDGYFADGFVDNIIHALSALKGLFVIARGSTLNYGGSSIDVRAIGAELGVRYVLYGSVQRASGRVRVSTELSDAETGEIIRADHYDGDLRDLFQLQDRIAEEIVKIIEPRVRRRELLRALRKHPNDLTAYDLVLQALDLLDRLEYEAFSRARGLLERAMILDPGYSPAFSYAAWWHSYRIGQEWSEDVATDAREAGRLAQAAIERDENDALALAIHGHLRSFLYRDYGAALESFDHAISASPNSAIAWTLKGATLCFMGDGPGALTCAANGLRLSPRDKHIFFSEHILAQAHYINGDFEEAVLWSRRADAHNNRLTSNLRTLIASLVATDRLDEAREIVRRHQEIAPRFSVRAWAARSPMNPDLVASRVEKLLKAGLPE